MLAEVASPTHIGELSRRRIFKAIRLVKYGKKCIIMKLQSSRNKDHVIKITPLSNDHGVPRFPFSWSANAQMCPVVNPCGNLRLFSPKVDPQQVFLKSPLSQALWGDSDLCIFLDNSEI